MDPHKDSSPAALVLVFDQMIRRLYEDDDCEDEFVDGMTGKISSAVVVVCKIYLNLFKL